MCLRTSRMPLSGPMWTHSSSACRRRVTATCPSVGGVGSGRPANAASRSPNSHGRPRQPRPITTPSHPVSATMASASAAPKMSPLPSTGSSAGSVSRSRAISDQSAVPE